MDTYQYLFPFEKIPCGSKVLIYGAGVLGQDYARQIELTGYCQLVCFADENYKAYQKSEIPVIAPDKIQGEMADYAVIALRGAAYLTSVTQLLKEAGFSDDQIVSVGIRDRAQKNNVVDSVEFQKNVDGHRMLFLMDGGFGDLIVEKKFVLAFLELLPDMEIDMYCTSRLEYAQWLFSDVPAVHICELNRGGRYQQIKQNYPVAINVHGFFIYVDQVSLPDRYFPASFQEKIALLKQRAEEDSVKILEPRAVCYLRSIYRGENVYTRFAYQGVLDIHDMKVPMPRIQHEDLPADLREVKYITINFGNGLSKENKIVNKCWPQEHFETLIAMLHQRFTELKIIQIGAAGAVKLKGADGYFLGRKFPIVGAILQKSLLHIDIEGGMTHLATQLGTKCIVLFGPTWIEFYGYPQNINLRAGGCYGCRDIYLDPIKCAKGLESPACMAAITPESVAKAAEKELNKKRIPHKPIVSR